MNNIKGTSFVAITIIVAVLALALRFTVEQVIKINIVQNESNALNTVKLISTALENYAKQNVGVFPASLSVLLQTKPPYLDKDYITQSPIKGYNYNFSRLEPYTYSLKAVPAKCNLTGKKAFSVTTGGLLISEDCFKKE